MPLRFLRIPKRLVGGEIQKYDMIFSPDVVRVVAILEVLQNYDRVEDLNESQFNLKTCVECKELHGKIFPTEDVGKMVRWPMHLYCRCTLDGMDVLPAGYATQDGLNGADYWLTHKGKLPENYLTKEEAKKIGWKNNKGNLSEVANGKIIGGDVYSNHEGRLPQANGRIWYEADINYTSGYRGTDRLFYSNDGLIFVSYDHGATFYEIQIKE